MDEKNERTITVPFWEYSDLATRDVEHTTFINALLESAKLSYNRKELSFDDAIINTMIKTLQRFAYNSRLAELQREREETLCDAVPDSTTIKV